MPRFARPSARPAPICAQLLLAVLTVLGGLSGCAGEDDGGSTMDAGAGGETEGEHPCGGDYPDSHGQTPDRPDDSDIVAACEAMCEAQEVVGCGGADSCADDCAADACFVCPDALAAFAQCLADNFEAAACSCMGGTTVCETPTACEDAEFSLGACGG